MEELLAESVRAYQKRSLQDFAGNIEKMAWFVPPPDPNAPPRPQPEYVPPPYEPSARAKQLLKDLRAAQRKGKRGKQLLAIIDALLDEVADEAREDNW